MLFKRGMGPPALRRLVAGTLGLLAFIGLTVPAFAGLSVCRADPILVLTDGTQLQLTASISSDPSVVQQITYTVHAPQGTALRQVTYTGGALLGKETVAFYADQAARSFTMATTVRMVDQPSCASAVTATARVAMQGGVAAGSVSGQACAPLLITLHP